MTYSILDDAFEGLVYIALLYLSLPLAAGIV